jgi:hypothetical protein
MKTRTLKSVFDENGIQQRLNESKSHQGCKLINYIEVLGELNFVLSSLFLEVQHVYALLETPGG